MPLFKPVIKHFTCNTSIGNQTVTADYGDIDPDGYMVFLQAPATGGTGLAASTANKAIAVGAYASSLARSMASYMESGTGTQEPYRWRGTNVISVRYSDVNPYAALASHVSMGQDGSGNPQCTFNWTVAAPAAWRGFVLFAAADAIYHVVNSLGNNGSSTDYDMATNPDFCFVYSPNATFGDAGDSFDNYSFGVVLDPAGAAAQWCTASCSAIGTPSGFPVMYHDTGACAKQMNAATGAVSWTATAGAHSTGTGLSLTVSDGNTGGDDVAVLGFDTGGLNVAQGVATTPLGIDPGPTEDFDIAGFGAWTPGFSLLGLTTLEDGDLDTARSNTADAGHHGLYITDGTVEATVGWTNDQGDGNIACTTYVHDRLEHRFDDGSDAYSGSHSSFASNLARWVLDRDGFNEYKWPYFLAEVQGPATSETITIDPRTTPQTTVYPLLAGNVTGDVTITGTTTGVTTDVNVRLVESGTDTPVTGFDWTSASDNGGNAWEIIFSSIPAIDEDTRYQIQARDGTDDGSKVTLAQEITVALFFIEAGDSQTKRLGTKDSGTIARQHVVLRYDEDDTGVPQLVADDLGETVLGDALAAHFNTPIFLINWGVPSQGFHTWGDGGGGHILDANYTALVAFINQWPSGERSVEAVFVSSFVADVAAGWPDQITLEASLAAFQSQIQTDFDDLRNAAAVPVFLVGLGRNGNIAAQWSEAYGEVRTAQWLASQTVTNLYWAGAPVMEPVVVGDEVHFDEYDDMAATMAEAYIDWRSSSLEDFPRVTGVTPNATAVRTDVTITLPAAATTLTGVSPTNWQVYVGSAWETPSAAVLVGNDIQLTHSNGVARAVRYLYAADIDNTQVALDDQPTPQALVPYREFPTSVSGGAQAENTATTALRRAQPLAATVADSSDVFSLALDFYIESGSLPSETELQYLWTSRGSGGFNTRSIQLFINASDQIRIVCKNAAGTANTAAKTFTGTAITSGVWHTLRIRIDKSGVDEGSMWLDGVEETTGWSFADAEGIYLNDVTSGPSTDAMSYVLFGSNGNDFYMRGRVSRCMLWQTALDFSVQATYDNPPEGSAVVDLRGNADELVNNRAGTGFFYVSRGSLTSVAGPTLVLSVDSLSLAMSLEAPAPTAASTLAVDDLSLPMTLDSPLPLFGGVLTVEDLALGMTLESPTPSTGNELAVDDLSLAMVLEAPAPTFAGTLVVADLSLAMALEAVTLSTAGVLAPNDLSLAMALESPAPSFSGSLTVDDLSLAMAIEVPTPTFSGVLAPNDLSLAMNLEAPDLVPAGALVVQPLSLAMALDSPTLLFGGFLTVQPLSLAMALESPSLSTSSELVVADLSLATALEAVTLQSGALLTVQDLALAMTLESPAVIGDATLTVNDLSLAMTIGTPNAFNPAALITASPAKTVLIKPGRREITVRAFKRRTT